MQSEARAMLLDHYLPQYDVTETYAIIVDADPDLTWHAVRRSDLSRSAVVHVLLELRSLPNRLHGVLKGRPSETAHPPLTLDDMKRAGSCSWTNGPAARSCSDYRAAVERGHRRQARAEG